MPSGKKRSAKNTHTTTNKNDDENEEPASQEEENIFEKLTSRRIPPTLFQVAGQPMIFYIAPCNTKDDISKLIVNGGGLVQKFPNPNTIILVESKSDLTEKIPGDCYSINYVIDCVSEGRRLEITKYIVNLKRRASTKDSFTPRKRILFTSSEDEKLIEFVNNHGEYTPSSVKLWQLAETENLFDGHTWQSMRSRYLKVARKLNFNDEGDFNQNNNNNEGEEDISNGESSDDLNEQSITRANESIIEPEFLDGMSNDELDDILTQDLSTKPRNNASAKKNNNNNNNINNNNNNKNNNNNDNTDEDYSEVRENDQYVKEIVLSVIHNLMVTTKLPRSVVVHGLIVNNGVVSDTIQYLRNPQDFFSTRSKSAQIWTYTEDKMVLDKHERGLNDLTLSRGKTSLKRRQEFLES